MTNQDAINKIWDWFFVQNKPVKKVKRFFNQDGNRCAVGVLLTEEECKRLDERGKKDGGILFNANFAETYGLKSIKDVNGNLLAILAECYDKAANNSHFKTLLQREKDLEWYGTLPV